MILWKWAKTSFFSCSSCYYILGVKMVFVLDYETNLKIKVALIRIRRQFDTKIRIPIYTILSRIWSLEMKWFLSISSIFFLNSPPWKRQASQVILYVMKLLSKCTGIERSWNLCFRLYVVFDIFNHICWLFLIFHVQIKKTTKEWWYLW